MVKVTILYIIIIWQALSRMSVYYNCSQKVYICVDKGSGVDYSILDMSYRCAIYRTKYSSPPHQLRQVSNEP